MQVQSKQKSIGCGLKYDITRSKYECIGSVRGRRWWLSLNNTTCGMDGYGPWNCITIETLTPIQWLPRDSFPLCYVVWCRSSAISGMYYSLMHQRHCFYCVFQTISMIYAIEFVSPTTPTVVFHLKSLH